LFEIVKAQTAAATTPWATPAASTAAISVLVAIRLLA
jgi:hypothetical protein